MKAYVPGCAGDIRFLTDCRKSAIPVVAVVRGIAAGGGLELALSCDFIYAADSARFSLPEAGLGLIQGWGGTFRMPLRTGAAIAKELLFFRPHG